MQHGAERWHRGGEVTDVAIVKITLSVALLPHQREKETQENTTRRSEHTRPPLRDMQV